MVMFLLFMTDVSHKYIPVKIRDNSILCNLKRFKFLQNTQVLFVNLSLQIDMIKKNALECNASTDMNRLMLYLPHFIPFIFIYINFHGYHKICCYACCEDAEFIEFFIH